MDLPSQAVPGLIPRGDLEALGSARRLGGTFLLVDILVRHFTFIVNFRFYCDRIVRHAFEISFALQHELSEYDEFILLLYETNFSFARNSIL